LVERAIEIGRHGYQLVAILTSARLAVERGDLAEAARRANEVLPIARGRRDRPITAGALEVLAQVEDRVVERRAYLDEARTLWQETGSPIGLASFLLVEARLSDDARALEAGIESERIFHAVGARGLAVEAADRVAVLRAAATPPVFVAALGGFRVVRDGRAVAVTEWQSRKARDLLKILVARRGRPTSREALFEALWPDDDPEPLANRLSVALTTVRSVLDPSRSFPPEHYISADKRSVALNLAHLPTDVEAFFTLAEAGHARLGRAMPMPLPSWTQAEATYAGDFLEEDPRRLGGGARRNPGDIRRGGSFVAGLTAVLGDVDGAIRLWLRVLEGPIRRGAHLELVGLLSRAGRHGEAPPTVRGVRRANDRDRRRGDAVPTPLRAA
jgi:hypothetical protein